MTRFTTIDGRSLGARFAGDKGATMHLTPEEAKLLFNLPYDERIIASGNWNGNTIKDLIDLVVKLPTATKQEMMRRFQSMKSLAENNMLPTFEEFLNE